MTDVRASYAAPRQLPDPWERNAPIPLDGPFEQVEHRGWRRVFWRLFQAFTVLAFALILFQSVSYAVAVLLLMAQGIPQDQLVRELTTNLSAHVRAVLVGNTVGQFVGLALPVVLVARLHSTRRAAFLRLRPVDGRLLGLSVLGLVALGPVVMWLGSLNSTLPMPEWVKVMEEMQMQLIEQVLASRTGIVFNLVALALTPALCEEVLFRGYVQRQAERGAKAAGGIASSGLLFGFYHFRPSQFLPLSVLGLYLAYLVWRTGSLWPAIVVHFANNAFAVVTEAYLSGPPEPEAAETEQPDVAWYLVVGGAVLFVLLLAALQRTAKALQPARNDDAPRPNGPDRSHEIEPPTPDPPIS